MAFETSKLRGKIVEKFGTIDAFSQRTSLTRASISAYLNGQKVLNQKDIEEWRGLLEIQIDEIPDYFFKEKVDEKKLADF